jgi:hypothetical protein
MNRRHFLTSTLAGAAALGSTPFVLAQNPTPAPTPKSSPAPGTEPQRPAPIDAALVKEFVGAGHANIPRVKEMLAVNPALINACWDWGAGDFETALGGASHIGHRPMALLLLESGARMDAFCAAMLGETEMVASLLRLTPACANTRGPHGYSMLYHAGYSGKLAIAEAIGPHLKERARDCNETLRTASLAGHTDFVAWLLKNGVDNPNTKTFQGKTPLDLATEQKHETIVSLLRAAGGTAGR